MSLDFLYVNGCSHTAGGGLYEDLIKNAYKEKFSISWESERDVTFSKYVADYFNLTRFDDSQCGSGAPRLIRKTYEYIENFGLEQAKKTLFLLQINGSMNRVEMYCKAINDYIIVNVGYDTDESINYLDVVEKWSHSDKKYEYNFFKDKIKDEVKHYLENYHDPMSYQRKIQHELLGLFSFLDKNEIKYFYFPDDKHCLGDFFDMNKPNEHHVRIGNSSSCHEWTCQNNSTIKDEISGVTNDTHPGYFGHLNYGKLLNSYLKERI